jgi:deazaflavin-dependent oxidoreductase (nitroreductase family)
VRPGLAGGQNGGMPSRIVQSVRHVFAPLSRTRAFRKAGPRFMPWLERMLAAMTSGKVQVSGLLVPSLVLRTIGAKSGEPREVVLMYTPDGHGRAIVAGSNFAGENHPAWSTNLLAHPDAEIAVRGRRLAVHATLIGDDERDAVWARIERQWPGYRGYERSSGRTVRLFRLQPVRALGHETR